MIWFCMYLFFIAVFYSLNCQKVHPAKLDFSNPGQDKNERQHLFMSTLKTILALYYTTHENTSAKAYITIKCRVLNTVPFIFYITLLFLERERELNVNPVILDSSFKSFRRNPLLIDLNYKYVLCHMRISWLLPETDIKSYSFMYCKTWAQLCPSGCD